MVFLNVPYAEKDAAKALGARWNPTRRRWYVPDGAATEAFAKWIDGASGDGAPAARAGRVDSYQGKTVVGANYVDLAHDCNPLETCSTCGARLAGTSWARAQDGLRAVVAGLGAGGAKRTTGRGAS